MWISTGTQISFIRKQVGDFDCSPQPKFKLKNKPLNKLKVKLIKLGFVINYLKLNLLNFLCIKESVK